MKRHALSASSIREHLLSSVFDRDVDALPVAQGRLTRTAIVSVGKSRVARSAAIDVSGSRPSGRSKADRIDPVPSPVADGQANKAAPLPGERMRHRFAISHAEYELLSVLKARMSWIDRPTKRGELLRAGLVALSSLSDAELKDAVDRLPRLKPVKAGHKKRSNGA